MSRDDDFYAAYRASPDADDGPPAALDARILERARQELSKTVRRKSWSSWLVPASVTAVAILGVAVSLRVSEEEQVLRLERNAPLVEERDTEALRMEPEAIKRAEPLADVAADRNASDAGVGVPPPSTATIALPADALERSERRPETQSAKALARSTPMQTDRRQQGDRRQQAGSQPDGASAAAVSPGFAPLLSPPSAPAEAKAAAAPPPSAMQPRQSSGAMPLSPVPRAATAPASEALAEQPQRALRKESGGVILAPEASPFPADLRGNLMAAPNSQSDERVQSPEDWLAQIRRDDAAGERQKAAESLREFRRVYPDYKLPENLSHLFNP